VYRSAVTKNGPSPGPMCESCGSGDGPLEPVRRVYLETDGHGGLRVARTVADIERWCPTCRTVYPNEPGSADEPAHADRT
jgi:hypothetical protein